MSFWSTPGFAEVSDLSELIDSGTATLEQLIDEPLARQDLRAGQKKVIDFLKTDENLVKLVNLALSEPEINDHVDRQTQFSKQKIATDLLTIGGYLAEAILLNDSCLKILDEFIRRHPSTSDGKGKINPLTMSFYTTIMTALFNNAFTKSLSMFGEGQKGSQYLESVINHIGYSCLRDIPVRIVTLPETQEDNEKMRKWFCNAKIGTRLAHLLATTNKCECMMTDDIYVTLRSSSVHNRMANIEQTWIDMVKGIRDVTPSDSPDAEINDDLLKHLSTGDSINDLITQTLCSDARCEKMIEHSCNILILLLRAHHFPKCPSNLALLALSSDRGKWVPTAQLATQELQGKPGDLDTAANEFNVTRIGLADRIDDSHMPIDEHQAKAREEVEYVLTKHLETITDMMRKNKLNIQARTMLVKLFVALINNDYAPAHAAIHHSKILIDLLPLLLDEDHITYSFEQAVLRELLQTLLFCRPPVTDATPAPPSSDDKVITISNPMDIVGLQQDAEKKTPNVRIVGQSPLVAQALIEAKLLTNLIAVGRLLTESIGFENPRKKRRTAGLKNFALQSNSMQLVRVIENARLRGPNRLLVESILQKNGLHDEWLKFVTDVYVPYREYTQPDDVPTMKYDSIDLNAIRLTVPSTGDKSNESDMTRELNKIFQTAFEKTTRVRTINENDCDAPQRALKLVDDRHLIISAVDSASHVPDRIDVDAMFGPTVEQTKKHEDSLEIAPLGDVDEPKRTHKMKTRSQKSKGSDDEAASSESSSDERSSVSNLAAQHHATVVDSHYLQQRQRQFSAQPISESAFNKSAPSPAMHNDNWANFDGFDSGTSAEPDWVQGLTNEALEHQRPPEAWGARSSSPASSKNSTSDFAVGFAAGIMSDSSDLFINHPPNEPPPPLPGTAPPVPKRNNK